MGANANWALIPIPAKRAAAFLERWAWLVDRPVQPFALSLFGDLFVEARDGSVSIIDAMEGVMRGLTASRRAFESEVAQGSDSAREWLLLDTVELLKERGVLVRAGQCYGWKVPPLLGAPLTTDNVEVFEIDVYQTIVSTFLEALRQVPPGTPISGFTVDGKLP